MDIPTHAVCIEPAAEIIPARGMHHKLVKNMPRNQFRKTDKRVIDHGAINPRQLPPQSIFLGYIWQFDIEYSCLHRIKPAVEATVDVMIPTVAPIICQRPHRGSQTFITSCLSLINI